MTFQLRAFSGRQRARVRIGADTEDMLEHLHKACALAGIAHVHKVATPYKIVGRHGKHLLAVPERKSGCDYKGWLCATRQAVVLEAKRWAAKGNRRFPLSVVQQHQQDELDRAVKDGCLALLVVVWGPLKDLYAVEWKALGRPRPVSLSLNDLAPYFVPRDRQSRYLERFLQQSEVTR